MRHTWLFLAPLLTGCAAPVMQMPAESASGCRHYFAELDRSVRATSVQDEGAYPIPGFPYLRVNRFLASFADEVMDEARFTAWIERLAQLDREGRGYEIANLPAIEQQRLAALTPVGKGLVESADTCRATLVKSELALPANRKLLRANAKVPDNYVTGWRILGLYPLTALFVKAGISKWHRETKENFALPLEQLPQEGQWQVWAPPASPTLSTAEVADLLHTSANNQLAIPEPDAVQTEALFATFAPLWRIDTVDDNDRPGTPFFPDALTTAQIDTNRPAVFRRISYTRFNGEVLLQLNYIIWFKSRPKASSFDIYAGNIDGINFRITLGSDGRPLLYDTIHNCGCYHMFFPVAPLTRTDAVTDFWTEAPLVPQVFQTLGVVPVISVNSHVHFIQRVSFTPHKEGTPFLWDDYSRLRSIEVSTNQHRSLFGEHGIIKGSERPERVLLWPLGIRSPGAMRQWGNHPTVFVGRRHYDDPYLIERLFTLMPSKDLHP